jgi:hypothetical protein
MTAPEQGVDEVALTAAHLAVEDVLIEHRDARIGVLGPRNGFIVNERDGSPSPIMRLGTRDGLRIAIEAYLAYLSVLGTGTTYAPADAQDPTCSSGESGEPRG